MRWSGRRRRSASVPRAALVCAAIAFANAVAWAVITPIFWVPDEGVQAGYAQHLAETGDLPNPQAGDDPRKDLGLAGEQAAVFSGLPWSIEGRPSWNPEDDRRLRRELESGQLTRSRPGQALYVDVHPPLYYLLETVPYRLTYEATFLDRMMAMRVLSALLGGLTVFFVFLFLREVLPRTPWVWTVGALVVAFQPVLGFMAGGVNNDVLAYAASAGVFYGVARAFRRGLDTRSAVLIGAAMAAGLLAKANVIGLLPGTMVALGALVWRMPGHERRRGLLNAGIAVATVAIPWIAWVVIRKQALGDAPAPAAGLASKSVSEGVSPLREQASYVWQALLPRLPFMEPDQVPNYIPWETFFKGFIGRFGWFEYGFATAWYFVALGIFTVLAGLAARELHRCRRALRTRWLEALSYATMAGGLVVALEAISYRYLQDRGVFFEQTRYLFPLLALYAVFVALAVRGAGRRWAPATGGLLVVLAMGHSLFSQLLTISRFYS